uniref:Phosphoesterase n=1 Tax=Pseudothermotoga hypogea TaxID=57487 RepID=A0A832MPY3_9THEM
MILRKILIVSDTHGSLTSWQRLKSLVGQVDEVYHLGDVLYHGPRNPIPDGYNPAELARELRRENLFLVRGNCDADVDLMLLGISEAPKVLLASFGQVNFVMSHGDFFQSEEQLFTFLEEHGAHVLLYAHTHVPRFDWIQSRLIINSGSPSLPKMGSEPTFVLMEINEVVKISLISLTGKLLREALL